MKIRTKFNIRDFVYYIDKGRIQQGVVTKIDVSFSLYSHLTEDGLISIEVKERRSYCVGKNVQYTANDIVTTGNVIVEEEEVFASREQLLEHLKNS